MKGDSIYVLISFIFNLSFPTSYRSNKYLTTLSTIWISACPRRVRIIANLLCIRVSVFTSIRATTPSILSIWVTITMIFSSSSQMSAFIISPIVSCTTYTIIIIFRNAKKFIWKFLNWYKTWWILYHYNIIVLVLY